MTILVRLWRKGRLQRRREGRAYAYHPTDTRERHAATRMQEFLAASGDRPAALGYFVASLAPSDRAQLRTALADRPRPR
jgi:predicted transcriptional regulator